MLDPVVRVVDDEESVRNSRKFLLTLAGFEVVCYESGEDFLRLDDFERPGCIILDLKMNGLSGLEVQEELNRRSINLPIIFVTGHGEVNAAVLALKRGAFDFLEKPVDPKKLQEYVRRLVKFNVESNQQKQEIARLKKLYKTLSPREKQVAAEVAKCDLNKVIAVTLGLAEQTVKIHRSNIFHKLELKSNVDLALFLQKLNEEEKSADGLKSSIFIKEEAHEN